MGNHNHSTVFITGINGMTGAHLAVYLLENTNWTVHGLSRHENLGPILRPHKSNPRLHFYQGDIKDHVFIDSIVKHARPDYVYHLAAQSIPRQSFDIPIDTLHTNIIGTASLLESLRLNEVDALIHVCSSSEVLSKITPANSSNGEYEFQPSSPYAVSKVAVDLLGKLYYDEYGMKVIVTRTFNTTGPGRGDTFAESSFARQIVQIERGEKEPVIQVGNLQSRRTFADVRDIARAYYMLLTHNPVPGECYNLSGNYTCSIGEMLELLVSLSTRAADIKIEVNETLLRKLDEDLQESSCEKFIQHTGWQPEYDFRTTMHDLLEYWRDNLD